MCKEIDVPNEHIQELMEFYKENTTTCQQCAYLQSQLIRMDERNISLHKVRRELQAKLAKAEKSLVYYKSVYKDACDELDGQRY